MDIQTVRFKNKVQKELIIMLDKVMQMISKSKTLSHV